MTLTRSLQSATPPRLPAPARRTLELKREWRQSKLDKQHHSLSMLENAGRARPAFTVDSLLIQDNSKIYGVLKINSRLNNMFAICWKHGASCTRTRTLTRVRTRGRPIGTLAAWLVAQERFPDRDSHRAFQPPLQERMDARLRAKAEANYAMFLEAEYPKRENSDSEPNQG